MNDPDTDMDATISLVASASGATAAEARQALSENGGNVDRAMSQLCYEKNHNAAQPDVENNITSRAPEIGPEYSLDPPTAGQRRDASSLGKCLTFILYSLQSYATRNLVLTLGSL